MKKIIPFIISIIKADLEWFVYALKTDNLGYDLGDFLNDLDDFSKYCRRKIRGRKMRRKMVPVRQSIYAKR